MASPSPRPFAAVVAFALLGPASFARADENDTSGCALKPIQDVPAAQARVRAWAEATGLPPFDSDRSALAIDRSQARLTLRFTAGELTVAWALDDDCHLDAIAIEPSSDYTGARPGKGDVRRLAAELEAVSGTRRVAEPYVPGRPKARLGSVLRSAAWAIAAMALALGVFWLVRSWWAAGVLAWRRASLEAKRALSAVGAEARGLSVRSAALARAGASRVEALMSNAREARASQWVRAIGLAWIVARLPYQDAPTGSGVEGWLVANAVVFVGVLPLVGFLWLAVTGWFGWGSARRADWPALVVFLVALVVREGIARHAIGDNELYFYLGVSHHRHSVVHPLFQMFLQPLASDPYAWMMHVNGVLGALATLPLFLFVRQRTQCVRTAAIAAFFFSVHPVIVQMAPTDLPYSLLLCAWFSGLALLSTERIGPRQWFGGATLLGIAATSRAEGSLYLVASLLLMDVRALLRSARGHRGAALLGIGMLGGLLAVHAVVCIPDHIEPGTTLPSVDPLSAGQVVRAWLVSYDYNHPTFLALVAVGAGAGAIDRRWRLGLSACAGALVVLWPFATSTDVTRFLWIHRLAPTCALQTIAAAVGASWLVSTLSRSPHPRWATFPALGIGLLMFADGFHAIRAPNAITDEFWMLRRQLAPDGEVTAGCALLSVGRPRDTDIQELGQVVPGMRSVRCESEDCVGIASEGGCFYYVRSINCFFFDLGVPLECRLHGRTSAGGVTACLDARCTRLERELVLEPLEERTVDVDAAFPDPQMPQTAEIGVYRVVGVRR